MLSNFFFILKNNGLVIIIFGNVGEHPQEDALTNWATESYHKRLNFELKSNPSFETFSHDLFMFDMKNLREKHKSPDEITKYQNRETTEIVLILFQ